MTQPRINYSQLQYIFSDKVKIEVFDSSKSYKKDILVQYGDMIYMSLEDITPGEFDETKWRSLGKQYESGIGISIDDKIINNTLTINKIQDYLYTYESSSIDTPYEDIINYFEENYHNRENVLTNDVPHGACSSYRKGNFYGRSYDWYYNKNLTFVVHNKGDEEHYESIGVAQSVLEDIDFTNTEKLRLVPYLMLDGINEHGLFVNNNVVPTGDLGITTGTHPDLPGDYICMLMLPRYILDNFKTATEAVNWIRDEAKIYAPRNATTQIELHFMIGDSNKTYIVEFVNNEAVVIDATDFNPIMTNFYIEGTRFDEDGHIIPSSVTNYGAGLERYNILVDNIYNATDIDSARDVIDSVKYTKSYTEIYDESGNVNPNCWKTEFAADYRGSTVLPHPMDLHADSPLEDYIESGILDIVYNLYLNRSRDENPPRTWQTVHSSVYDIERRELFLKVQEGDKQYHFVFTNVPRMLQNIDEEIARAKAAEQAISGGVAEEARIRAEADTRLEGLIEAEEQARIAKDEELEESKQDKLIPGDGITINNNNVISTLWKKDTGEGSIVSVSNAANGGQAIGNFSVAEGFGTDAKGDYSHTEGQLTTANGGCAHAEGQGSTAQGNCSHAEGIDTIAQNQSEHAEGQYNKSHKANTVFGNAGNTIHSIGIGTGAGSLEEQDRRNAVEVMQNGDIYVDGIGNYDGADYANADTVQDVVSSINDSIDDLSENKQDKLIASTNIQIADDGKTISATDTTYTAGNGLTLTGTEFSANVVDNVTSTSSTNALSANMGKELQDQIDNLKARGRYLSQWNAVTGQPATQPTELPYPYKTGDYYLVGTVGEVNYKPTGTSYTGAASTTIETAELGIDDVYFFDGTVWHLQQNTQKTVTFASLAGSPYDNSNLSSALNDKVTKNNAISAATHTKITYDSKGLVTGGSDIVTSDVTDLTSTSTEINQLHESNVVKSDLQKLHNVTVSAEELNYTDGLTSNIQEQLDSKVDKTNSAKKIYGTDNSGNQTTYDYDSFGKVDDVKINGTSIVTDKIANIPVASSDVLGVIKSSGTHGTLINANYQLCINRASDTEIENKNQYYKPIVPVSLDKAIMEGLGNNSLTWTDEYKASARNTIGAQEFISDLSEIRAGAELGSTSIQPNDNISELTNDVSYQTDTQVNSAISTHNSSSTAHSDIRSAIASKSTVSVSATGTSTDEVQYITIDGVQKKLAGSGSSAIEEDNVTITKNASGKIQAIATIDNNTNATTPVYDWVGTLAEYEAQNIATLHPTWICYITDDVDTSILNSVYTKAETDGLLATMLSTIYPVGSIYIGTQATCPMSALISGSTWELVSAGRTLQGADSSHTAGSTIEAGLPNITGDVVRLRNYTAVNFANGAFYNSYKGGDANGTGSDANPVVTVSMDASRSSSIYGSSTTVQPPAYVVNIWRRTA